MCDILHASANSLECRATLDALAPLDPLDPDPARSAVAVPAWVVFVVESYDSCSWFCGWFLRWRKGSYDAYTCGRNLGSLTTCDRNSASSRSPPNSCAISFTMFPPSMFMFNTSELTVDVALSPLASAATDSWCG